MTRVAAARVPDSRRGASNRRAAPSAPWWGTRAAALGAAVNPYRIYNSAGPGATADTWFMVAPFVLSQGVETTCIWPHGYRADGDMPVLRFDLAATTVEALKPDRAAAFQSAQVRFG